MGRLGQIAGSIPFVPTKRSLGRRLLSKELAKLKGDADFVGIVRDHDGWHVVPSDYETDGDREWGVPADGSERYPADGVGGDWGTLYGVPAVVGYRNFGAARQLPNTRVARDVIVHRDGGEDVVDVEATVEEAEDPEPEGRVERLQAAASGLLAALPSRREAPPAEPGEYRLSRRFSLGLSWVLGDADALDLVQDSDGQWALERVDYELEDQMYNSRDSDSPYDAEGAGCAPKSLAGVPVGFSNGRFPMMLPPIRCRLGRNLVEERLAGERKVELDEKTGDLSVRQLPPENYGGAAVDGNGRAVLTDGGVPEGLPEHAPDPNQVQPGYNDIELEERAFVNPDDVKQLGDPESTQEKIESLVERAIASQNTPGGDLKDKALQYGGYFMALIMGWWFGQQSAGGGGGSGDGGSSASPLMADAGAGTLDVALQAQTLALDAGVGVI